MPLPTSGPISTSQIMSDGLGIPVQSMSWPSLWALASPGTIPKNKANAGGPYVLPTDWYGYTHTAPFFAQTFATVGYNFANDACTNVNPYTTYYTNVATIAVNTIIYTDSALTIPYDGGFFYRKHFKGNGYESVGIETSGRVYNIAQCAADVHSFTTIGLGNGASSCGVVDSEPISLYSTVAGLVVGDRLFYEATFTTPFNGGSAWFKSYDLNKSVQIDSNGTILALYDCNIVLGGTITLNIPGVGNNIAPSGPGSNVMSNYTLGSGIQINNTSATQSIKFGAASIEPPYPVIQQSGAARLLRHTASPVVSFVTVPADGEIIPPNSFATHVAFNGNHGSGIAVLSLETYTTAGGRQQFFWTFNV